MTWVAAGVAGGTALAGIYGASQNSKAAEADTATNAVLGLYSGMINQANLDNQISRMAPYVEAGNAALSTQRSLIGLDGADAQAGQIAGLLSSPAFTSMLKQGENSILQNAAATGGLRGGNTQAALAQFSPALLAQTINNRFTQLGSLSAAGQNAALGLGTLQSQAAGQQNSLTGGLMANNAANTQAQTAANNGMVNSITSGLGLFTGMRGPQTLSNMQASFAQSGLGASGFGTGLAYGNQDFGGYF